MKKRVFAIILVIVVIFSALAVLYYTSYPTIDVIKMVSDSNDNFKNEFHDESITISSAVIPFLPDSPLQKQKMDEVWEWNNSIVRELIEYRKAGGKAYNIEVSGEIVDGKTTLRYEGYIIKENDERIDYLQEKTFDFVICSEKDFLV